MQEVKIYTTPTCSYCQQAKAFFKEKNVEYTEYDVSQDAQKQQEMIERTGQMGVPVIQIGDEYIIGFDKNKISQLLGLN
jgi:glutaredoxin-like YruB-family protein